MCLNFVTSEPYEIFLMLKVFQTMVYISLSTVVLNSRDLQENLWLS